MFDFRDFFSLDFFAALKRLLCFNESANHLDYLAFLACLADLSRLIPSQYMRKGRGRVEKTEIIEMAIRHLKNLQTQEVLREATYADHYRSGYNDCVTEAAKFLLRERDEELYYKMITHLREHMNEAMKGETSDTLFP